MWALRASRFLYSLASAKYGLPPLLAVLAVAAGCVRGEPLTEQGIEQARTNWQRAALSSYRWHIEISGDRIEEGEFVADVRNGKLTRLTRNDQAVTARDPFYTVAGMYGFLREELEMAAQPGRFWQATKDARIYQRVIFDTERGFPKRYLRAVTGTSHNILIKSIELERL